MELALLPVMRRVDAIGDVMTRHRLEQAIAEGTVVTLADGVVVGRDLLQDADDATRHGLFVQAAILRVAHGAVASHGSAALLRGLDRLGRPSGTVRLSRPRGRYRRVHVDARVHVCGLPAEHVSDVHGVPCTTTARTVVDLSRMASFRSGVVVADSALRLGCGVEELRAVAQACRGWPGIRRARSVIDFARGESESPLESVSRVFFHQRGIPEPQLQFEVHQGRFIGRVDFYWPEHRTIGEADGIAKYRPTDPREARARLIAEKLRQEALEDAGFVVVRWTWDEIWRWPDETERRIRAALSRGLRNAA